MKHTVIRHSTFVFFASFITILSLQHSVWLHSTSIASHDSIQWYGVFSYFISNLHQGILPLWNPYMHSGEPFYTNIQILHLWDPSTLLLISLSKLCKLDYLVVYHYDLLLRFLIFTLGAYRFFRRIAVYPASAYFSFCVLCFSTAGITYLRQNGFLISFYLFPWILLCTLKIIEDKKPRYWFGLVLCGGLTATSYHAIYVLTALVILLPGMILSASSTKKKLLDKRIYYTCMILSLILFILLVSRMIPLSLTLRNNYEPVLRMMSGATLSLPADFAGLFLPYLSSMFGYLPYFIISESFLYIGLFPLMLGFVGIVSSSNRLRPTFVISLLLTSLLMLGPGFFIDLITRLFPGFSIIRNMHTFNYFFIFCLVSLTCMGLDTVIRWSIDSSNRKYFKPLIFSGILVTFFSVFLNFAVIFLWGSNYVKSAHQILGATVPLAELMDMLSSVVDKHYLNAAFFALGVVILLILLLRRHRHVRKCCLCLFFLWTLVDLGFHHHHLFPRITESKHAGINDLSSTRVHKYRDYRLPEVEPKLPFKAFSAALYNVFTAYSLPAKTQIGKLVVAWPGYFFMNKDYLRLIYNKKISYENKQSIVGVTQPKLRWVPFGQILSDDEALLRMGSIPNGIDRYPIILDTLPSDFLHLKNDLVEPMDPSNHVSDIRVSLFEPNRMSLDITTQSDGILFYSDGYDKAWRAYVDNEEVPVLKAYTAFKAIALKEGTHLVRFVYTPKGYMLGLLFYFVALLFLTGFLLLPSRIYNNSLK